MPSRTAPDAYHQQFQTAVFQWVRPENKDSRFLEEAATTLQRWLNDYPAQARTIGQVALSTGFTTRAHHLYELVARFAGIGMDAAMFGPMQSADDRAGFVAMALLAAEALLELNQPVEARKMLDRAQAFTGSLTRHPLYPYLLLHQNAILGLYEEAALEAEHAAGYYRKALAAGKNLVYEEKAFSRLCQSWQEVVFGSALGLRQEGVDMAAGLLRADIQETYRQAALGLARTDDAHPAEAALEAIQVCLDIGLPTSASTLSLRSAVANLPLEALEQHLPALMNLAEKLDDPKARAAWKTMICSTRALRRANGPQEQARESLLDFRREVRYCTEAFTMALSLGDLLMAHLRDPGKADVFNEVRSFLSIFNTAMAYLVDTPYYLPYKKYFDTPITLAIDWAFETYRTRQDVETGALLSVLFDALRSSGHDNLPMGNNAADKTSVALMQAFDRVQRLVVLHQQLPGTAFIAMQGVGDSTLFIAAGSAGLVLEKAGDAYRQAGTQLSKLFRRDIEKGGAALSPEGVTETARGIQIPASTVTLEQLQQAGQKAMDCLPERIKALINDNQHLLLVPDFQAGQDAMPFELLHDGSAFIGLRKNLSRFLSLQELLRSVEPPTLAPQPRKRGICAAVETTPGLPTLAHAGWEVAQIRERLQEQAWDLPDIPAAQLDGPFLLEAGKYAGLLHVSAHGGNFAGKAALFLPEGQILSALDIESKKRIIPAFVFLNTCSLGSSRYLGGGVSRGMAFAFSRAYAPAVMANLLPVDDQRAAQLSVEFYRQAQEHPVGEALRLARVRLHESGVFPTMWASTVLIGNPFYHLPGQAPEPIDDPVAALLNAYLSPDASDQERAGAYVRARDTLARNPGHRRLEAALSWVHLLSGMDPESSVDEAQADKLALLARELGFPAGEALVRYDAATHLPAATPLADRIARLQLAVEALESLAPVADFWYRVHLDCLAQLQRLTIPREPSPITGLAVPVNDQSDPAVRAFFDIQHAIDQQEIRRSGKLDLHIPEDTLEKLAWNAIVIGQQDRFSNRYAQAEFAELLSQKLLAQHRISAESQPHASCILGGILPFLWESQRITHLERERAAGQCRVFQLILDNICNNESSPLPPAAATLEAQLQSLINSRRENRLSRYGLALQKLSGAQAAPGGIQDLKSAILQSLETDKAQSPQSQADLATWLLGCLLLTVNRLQLGDEPEKTLGEELEALYEELNGKAEGYFSYYLFKGYGEQADKPQEDVIMRWRAKG